MKPDKFCINTKLKNNLIIQKITRGYSITEMFPEIDYNEIDKLRGLQINIVTTTYNDNESKKLLELLGMPFEDIN